MGLGDAGLVGGQLSVEEGGAQLARGRARERGRLGEGGVEAGEGGQVRRALGAPREVRLRVPRCGKIELAVSQRRQDLDLEVRIHLPHYVGRRTAGPDVAAALQCPVMAPRYRPVEVRMPADLMAALDRVARRRGVSRSALMREVARRLLAESSSGVGARADAFWGSAPRRSAP